LWKKSARKTPYLAGFIAGAPDDLPGRMAPRKDLPEIDILLSDNATPAARLLLKSFSESGQLFLDACLRILSKPPTQDVITTTLDTLRGYYAALRPTGDPDMTLDDLHAEAAVYATKTAALQPLLSRVPALRQEVEAMRILSGLGYGALRPELKGSSATGGLMRRKLEPVLGTEQFLRRPGMGVSLLCRLRFPEEGQLPFQV